MPAERVSMRKIRDVLRLTHALGMSRRLVAEATGIGKTAVGEYVRRAVVGGLSWPIPDEIDDAELERRLFPPADTASCATRAEPDWSHIHAELKGRARVPRQKPGKLKTIPTGTGYRICAWQPTDYGGDWLSRFAKAAFSARSPASDAGATRRPAQAGDADTLRQPGLDGSFDEACARKAGGPARSSYRRGACCEPPVRRCHRWYADNAYR